MEEILRQALVILRATWKHRRLGMLVAWVVGAIAAGVILRIPDKYEASARIFVDTQSILKPLMSGLAVQPNVEQQVMRSGRSILRPGAFASTAAICGRSEWLSNFNSCSFLRAACTTGIR